MPDQLAREHPAPGHLALDDLADLAVGELPVDASATAEAHLASCPACRSRLTQVRADLEMVAGELGTAAAEPVPPMPVTVAARLDRVLAEAANPSSIGAAGSTPGAAGSSIPGPTRRPAPLKAPATATYAKQTGAARIMLAAAAAAAIVGFGGYLISASAGLNEPTSLSPTQVQPAALASHAESLAQSRDLDPHLFSAAWRCARTVTSGRITGIAPVYVEGRETYLVYTRSGGVTFATLVSGCDENPTAGERVRLTR